jgi:hypothetical protein
MKVYNPILFQGTSTGTGISKGGTLNTFHQTATMFIRLSLAWRLQKPTNTHSSR